MSQKGKRDVKAGHGSKKSSGTESQASSGSDCPSVDQDQQDRLDRELLWCIEQLRIGMSDKLSNDKKIAEASKILRVLESSTTPVPRKRQLMRATFGDYRKKMEDEIKQIDAKTKSDAKKVRVLPASSAEQSKSTFYRKCSSSYSSVASLRCADVCKFECSVADSSDSSSLANTTDGTFAFQFDAVRNCDENPVDAPQPEHVAPQPEHVSLTSENNVLKNFSSAGTEFRFDFDI